MGSINHHHDNKETRSFDGTDGTLMPKMTVLSLDDDMTQFPNQRGRSSEIRTGIK
jgi:hypothetical protein